MSTPDPSPLRLLILCAGDPENERTFSGSARSLIRALKKQNCVHHTANVLGHLDPFKRGTLPVRLFRKLDRFNLEENYRWSKIGCHRNSNRAKAIAQAHPGYNACLMYGTNYLPNLDVPTYCYFDTTSAEVLRSQAWEFEHFSTEKSQAIINYQQQVFDHCTTVFPRSKWAAQSCYDDYHLAPEKVCPAGAGFNHQEAPLPHAAYDKQIILFIGIDFERKGGPLILEAFQETRKQFPNATLRIIGCNPDIDQPGVEIIGRIPKDEPGGLQKLLHHYSEASIFTIMSHYEPFGIVIPEAAWSGVPCVVPQRFAFTETVDHGVTGYHVPEYDPALLAQTFNTMLSNPDKLQQMGEAAHTFAKTKWTWDAAATTIHNRILQDLNKE